MPPLRVEVLPGGRQAALHVDEPAEGPAGDAHDEAPGPALDGARLVASGKGCVEVHALLRSQSSATGCHGLVC